MIWWTRRSRLRPIIPAGMKFREILLLKAARLEQDHGERVAKREHDGRAGSGREIQRTRFLLDIDIEEDIAVLRQGRIGRAASGDDLDLKPRDRRQDAQQFLRLAAGAQREDDVAIGHHPEIAMQGVERVEHDRGRTGAGEGGGDFFADVAGFADPEDDYFAARFDGCL